ncbi:MAG TPA: acetylglutamate kinase [bacterium]|nr:acetylglutamate kinase [bacterium]
MKVGRETIKLLESLDIRYPDKYLYEFRGRSFVVKCGGSLMEDPSTGLAILDDVALLKKEGINPVLVHGGSVQADREMEAAGIQPKRYKGLRHTCERTIEILDRCFGALNSRIVEELKSRGADAAGFSGASGGGLIKADIIRPDGVDIGLVGDMTGLNRPLWDSILNNQLPVVSSLGVSPQGLTLNINADYVATKLALEIGADKLILMTDVAGVMLDPKDPSTLISSLTVSRARELIADGSIGSGMIPKIESATRAIESGLKKIHMINGRVSHSLLLEIFTDHGVGTEIKPD